MHLTCPGFGSFYKYPYPSWFFTDLSWVKHPCYTLCYIAYPLKCLYSIMKHNKNNINWFNLKAKEMNIQNDISKKLFVFCNYIQAHMSSLWWRSPLCCWQSSALFVMSMNADLCPLRWSLQPPWKFTGGSGSPCASTDSVLMETAPLHPIQPLLRKSVCLSQTQAHPLKPNKQNPVMIWVWGSWNVSGPTAFGSLIHVRSLIWKY